MASKIRKEQAYTFIETFKLLIDENDKLKAENEASKLDSGYSAPKDHPSLKTFIEKSPLVKQVKDLRTEIKELKENLAHTEDCSWDYYTELLELRKLKDENKKLYDKVKSLEWSQNVHIHEKIKLKEENKTLKEALNRIRRDLSPDR